MFFVGLGNALALLFDTAPVPVTWQTAFELWLYPLKAITALALLCYFWSEYDELASKNVGGAKELLFAAVVGLLVYFTWVRINWTLDSRGAGSGYDPFRAGANFGLVLAVVRVFGAVIVAPLVEELFWRSFLLRYLIAPQFESIPLGSFTTASFVATTVLFGLEHRLFVAGMVAGAAYALVLYRSRSLWTSVVAHGVTNLALAVHALVTQEWRWW